MSISVAALRRFPVKAMGGEPLDDVRLDSRGLVGDRGGACPGEIAVGDEVRLT